MRAWLVFVTTALLGCTGPRLVLAPQHDPANPDAPESPPPPVPQLSAEPLPQLGASARPEEGAAPEDHSGHGGHQ